MQQFPNPSDSPDGLGARLFIGRLLEAFFRRWWLYLLPVVLLAAMGLVVVLGRGTDYRASGVILVNRDPLLNQLSSVGGQNAFGYDSAATYTSRQFNTLLGTDSFLDSVIKGAGLTTAVESGAITRDKIRGSLWAAPDGDELVVITAASPEPQLSYRLAGATMASYVQWEIDNNISQSQSSEDFFQSLLVPYQQRVVDAQKQLTDYLTAHPTAGSDADRPADEQVEISSLTDAVSRANDQLSTARSSLNAARLANAQTTTEVSQRLRVVDNPVQPTVPEPHRKKDALTLLMFMMLGALVAGAALVVATLLDRTVRYAEEVEAHLNIPVLATVPDGRGVIRTRVV